MIMIEYVEIFLKTQPPVITQERDPRKLLNDFLSWYLKATKNFSDLEKSAKNLEREVNE